jgi:hypothetical protein
MKPYYFGVEQYRIAPHGFAYDVESERAERSKMTAKQRRANDRRLNKRARAKLKADLRDAEALENPAPVVTAVAAVGVASLGWIGWRLYERRKLTQMIEASPYRAALDADAAATEIKFTNMTTAQQGYDNLVAKLPGAGLADKLIDTVFFKQAAQEGRDFAQSIVKAWR